MGYMCHHAIIVTSWSDEKVAEAHGVAVDAFAATTANVTDLTPPAMNAYQSFMVAPDGSKEGWEESDAGDAARAAFLDWLDAQRYDDGSSVLKWAEVQFGDENGNQRILRTDDTRASA